MTCATCGREGGHGATGLSGCPYEAVGGVRGAKGADVTWPGGRTFENLADTPQTFYSPAEKQRFMRERGIEEYVRHQPLPGSDRSPHTTSWAAVSQETLDGARLMLERVSKGTKDATETWVREFVPSTEVGVTRVKGRR